MQIRKKKSALYRIEIKLKNESLKDGRTIGVRDAGTWKEYQHYRPS